MRRGKVWELCLCRNRADNYLPLALAQKLSNFWKDYTLFSELLGITKAALKTKALNLFKHVGQVYNYVQYMNSQSQASLWQVTVLLSIWPSWHPSPYWHTRDTSCVPSPHVTEHEELNSQSVQPPGAVINNGSTCVSIYTLSCNFMVWDLILGILRKQQSSFWCLDDLMQCYQPLMNVQTPTTLEEESISDKIFYRFHTLQNKSS